MNTFTENMGIVLAVVSALAIAIVAIVTYNKKSKNINNGEGVLKGTNESNWGSIPDLKPKDKK